MPAILPPYTEDPQEELCKTPESGTWPLYHYVAIIISAALITSMVASSSLPIAKDRISWQNTHTTGRSRWAIYGTLQHFLLELAMACIACICQSGVRLSLYLVKMRYYGKSWSFQGAY
ncbi:hypothetical protein E4T56_gene6164 [Termitomyces sp. T112]|nr:hypothetical protein E4T56_gene6164 [Termitomyces sp. T112]